jgi:hypothetical protein
MTKKLYSAAVAALIGLAMSCGQAGEDVLSLIADTNSEKIAGAFVQFNANGTPSAQKIDLIRDISPIINFTDGAASKEEWLAAKGLPENYDFILDPNGFGPNWKADETGGGGDLSRPKKGVPLKTSLALL